MFFIFDNKYINKRYNQLVSLHEFSNSVDIIKYERVNYFFALSLYIISAFSLGFSIYYWENSSTKKLLIELLVFLFTFILCIFILQIIKNVFQKKFLNYHDINLLNTTKTTLLKPNDFSGKINSNIYIKSLMIPFSTILIITSIIIFSGLENNLILALSISNIVCYHNDITQIFYLSFYGKNLSIELNYSDNSSLSNLINIKEEANKILNVIEKLQTSNLENSNSANELIEIVRELKKD